MIEKDIYNTLVGYPGLTSMISTRVYPLRLPEGCERPAIVVQRISGGGFNTLDGICSIERPRFQFSCYAVSYGAAKNVAKQLKSAFRASTLKAASEGDIDSYDEQARLYRVTVDFFIWGTVDYSTTNDFAANDKAFAAEDWNFAE